MKKLSLLFIVFFIACLPGSSSSDKNVMIVNNTSVFVEIAETPSQKATGLMFRETLASNRGMLFIFHKPSRPSFYMKDTKIPLDILFIDKKHKIVSIQQMQPFDEENLHTPPVPVIWALEVNQNWSKRHNIKVNDTIVLKRKRK